MSLPNSGKWDLFFIFSRRFNDGGWDVFALQIAERLLVRVDAWCFVTLGREFIYSFVLLYSPECFPPS